MYFLNIFLWMVKEICCHAY